LARALPGKVEMKHQVNSSWVSYRNLGSVRVVTDGDGKVEQVNHYYAFGGLMGMSFNGDKQKYKYNGKELDRFLNWDMLDYGDRWYDSKLQCWLTVDPLAEKYYHLSPYVYCADNPVKYTDPNGKAFEPWIALQTDNRGNAIWIQNKSTKAFIRSMSRFGQTTIGRKLLGAFIPKGMKQYGVKGTGEFSDIAFQINEFNMSDKERQKDYLWGRDDNGIPCQISGALSAQKTDENEFVLNLKIDVSGSEKELQETIVHEFTLHGEKIEKTIKILRSKGVDAAIEYFNNSTQAEEHKKNKYYYDSTMKELINIK
jgi:RHS repeat-associated protein